MQKITKDSQNKGLPIRFELVNGKFQMLGGKLKADDNVRLFLAFTQWFRLYTQDFVLGATAYYYIQNTTSYLYQFKNILRLRILELGAKYLPFTRFLAVDIPINYTNRRETSLLIQYKYNLPEVQETQIIKKIVI